MITTIFFDLDGTLLPMEQEKFIQSYLGSMAKYMAPHGYNPELLVKAVWSGTGAMVRNDGNTGNDTVFWNVFDASFGRNCRADEPLFEEFYRGPFQKVQQICGFDPRAAEAVAEIRAMGYRTVLATNPLFPAIATHSRVRWAGLRPEDFAFITTYENSSRCKPNPDYYQEILDKLGLNAKECLMVGNDVREDMVARQLGMQVFLLTDCLINPNLEDISQYPNGSFPELLEYIRRL